MFGWFVKTISLMVFKLVLVVGQVLMLLLILLLFEGCTSSRMSIPTRPVRTTTIARLVVPASSFSVWSHIQDWVDVWKTQVSRQVELVAVLYSILLVLG